MVGIGGEFVVCDQVPGDRFTIVRAEEFGRGIPQLACIGWRDGVEGVFEFDVAFRKNSLKIDFVVEGGEVEGLARGEDDNLFGEVTVVGVVQTVWRICQLCTNRCKYFPNRTNLQ